MQDFCFLRALIPALIAALLTGFAPASRAAHAYAQFGDIKYAEGFKHFDYVNPAAPKGGEIRMVPPTRPTNFDKFNPFTLRGTAPYGLGILMIESLLLGNSEEPTTAYGLLADDVAVSDDKLSVTFHLNEKAHFHNGTPVLAADVLHSYAQLTSKLAAPQYRTIYAEVKSVTVVSDRVVRFDFLTPNPEMPLVVGGMPIFSRDWGRTLGVSKPFDKIVSELPIGSGPYKVANPAMGRDITYVRDPAYWGADLPSRKGQFNFDRVSFKIYLDETSRFEGLKAGEYDFLREFISRNWARQYTGKQFTSGELVKRALKIVTPVIFRAMFLTCEIQNFRTFGYARPLVWQWILSG